MKTICFIIAGLAGLFFSMTAALANVPGGGTNGANLTLTDNGSTVTLANGIVSIVCTKSGGSISQINYTYNNGSGTQTQQLLAGGTDGGQLYWENSSDEGLTFTYSLVVDPASNGGNYAEIALTTTSVSNDVLEVHFSMLRGSTGFYTTAIYSHNSTNAAFGMGECRDNIYAGAKFNWMSVDANRNRLMEVSGGLSIPVQGAPVECYLWTNGIYAGQYEDKYKYSADLGVQRVWGWSSVGTGGLNVGLWNVSASAEYYNGGPLKRELMSHIGTTILNMLNGGHYGMGGDGNFASGELWTKVYGPYFIYCNNVTNTLTTTNLGAQALYSDALAQAAAEAAAWPYSWFSNTNYAPATNRGTVTGQIVINDSGNPNASAANLWVGLIQQPSTTDSVYDFQEWMKPYQFWVKTDTNGNFTIPNVIATTNYTLYAFGPGSPGTFMSQAQTGGNPPNTFDLPASPFAVTVIGGSTNRLGTVTWSPARVAPTVFEIGYPDRMADKFRHSDDFWVGDIGPSATAPSPIWSKWLEYQFDFPNGPNYLVGQSRWTTDWNFIQPVYTDSQGNYDSSSSTITFNLAVAPANGALASLYVGLASDYYSAMIVTVNGNNLGNVSGVTGTPNNSIPTTGYYTGYSDSDTSIREGNNGAFSDERLTFPASQLHAGVNTINLGIRQIGGSYFADHAMYDYVRFELTGYIPPQPASVTAYAGNNCALVCWPVTPGATSYNVLRSTTAGSGYISVTNGVIGPVCGCGTNNATWLDATAVNGTTYYYVVQSVNPTGISTNSVQSLGVTPSASVATTAPAMPTGLTVTGSGHQSVTLSWSPSTGANYYSVWRSVLENTGGGSSNTLNTIILNNTNTATSFTDGSPTDGSIYRYFVTATDAGGTSTNSSAVIAVALPLPPASMPVSLTAAFYSTTNVVLNWNAVAGAVGYAIYRATSSSGPYTYLQTVTETVYYDIDLNAATVYYYRVVAVNAAAASANATDSVNSQQVFPASLAATSTNAQVTLIWPATTGATSYTVKRGTSTGNETFNVVTGYAGTTYTNTGLINGTTYYYVVTATGTGGTSGNSPEASATPFATSSGIWITPANGIWGAATNWSGGGIATGASSTANFSTLALPASLTVTLDTSRTISGLLFGDTSATYNWTLAGTNTLTLGDSPNLDVINDSATLSTAIAGTAGLSKNGPGTLVLNGPTNSFTGGVVVNAGNLTLDYSPTNVPTANLIPSANALTMNGGTLQISGSSNRVSSQTFASTTLNPGNAVITAAPASGSNFPTVNLGAITANAGGTVEFVGPATIGLGTGTVASNATIITTIGGSSAFVGGNAGVGFYDTFFATVGLYDYAVTTASSPYTVVGASQVSGFYTTVSGTAPTGGNLDVTGNITGWSGQPYLGSMRFNTSLGTNISVASYSTLTLPNILVTPKVGDYNVTFNAGTFRPGSSGYSTPFAVWQNNLGGELVLNTSIGNSKSSTSFYSQAGPGTVWINNTGTSYAGASYLNGGVTLIDGDASLGATATPAAVNLNGGTLIAATTFAMDNGGGTNPRPFNLLGAGGGLAAVAGATLTVDGVIGSSTGAGPLTIGIPAATNGLLPGTGPGTGNTTSVYASGTVVLTNANYYSGGTILQSGTLTINGINALGGADYGGLTFNGGMLQYTPVFTGNGSGDLTSSGIAGVTVATGGGTIDLDGNNITFTNAIGNGGEGSLTVQSLLAGGVLNLQGADTYSGNTTVTNATLLVNNLTGSATGSGNVLVQNGATLAGAGSVAGSVTLTAGATLAPGNPSNSLAIGNNLTLAAGSQTAFSIQPSPPANGSVNVADTLTENGTLNVTNANATAFASGDSFKLFSAANYSGSFVSFVLPPLATNLVWNTTQLNVDGSLRVVSTVSPDINQINLAGTNLVLSGINGTPGWTYYVLATTNLALPAVQWTRLATNPFDSSGNFNFTNAVNSGSPAMFFRIQSQ